MFFKVFSVIWILPDVVETPWRIRHHKAPIFTPADPGTDNLISDDEGSYLSYADGAIAVIDEVEQANHHFTRFTAGR